LRTLIFGYGNYDRQDDGAAWHVISLLRKALSIPDHETIDDDFISDDDLIFVFQLQLTPELAESVAQFDRVCFIDAHTGAVPEDVHYEVLHPSYQHSPLTHHLTPSSLLSIIQTIYTMCLNQSLFQFAGILLNLPKACQLKHRCSCHSL